MGPNQILERLIERFEDCATQMFREAESNPGLGGLRGPQLAQVQRALDYLDAAARLRAELVRKMRMTDRPTENTDRELWREQEGYYYASIHVTKQGGIGIDVGGSVIVKPLGAWHALASVADELRIVFDGPPGPENGRFVECETSDGRSVNAGQWHERPDGLWELRINCLQTTGDA